MQASPDNKKPNECSPIRKLNMTLMKILVDIFINKHDINKVLFKDSSREVERVPIDINSENFNLNDLIFDRIKGDDKLTKEFEKILEIYKGKDK